MTPPVTAALDREQRAALELLTASSSFLLIGHERPDGDCLGGQGALARGLRALGKEVAILNPDPPGEAFDYFTAELDFGVYSGGPLPDHEVCVLLDFNDLSRCGAMRPALERAPSKKLVIDHHPHHGRPWWDARFVDVSAAATGLLVRRILRELSVPLDEVSAHAIFTSIVTDTGWFRYSNTDSETLAAAAELVLLGVRPERVHVALFQRRPAGEPRALGALLSRLEYFAGGRLAVVDQPLPGDGEVALEDGDPVLDILRSVGVVEVVLYVRELEPGTCKLSARSKTDFDVNALARRFGGGGHVKAAGATIAGALPEVRERVVRAALEMLARGAKDGSAER